MKIIISGAISAIFLFALLLISRADMPEGQPKASLVSLPDINFHTSAPELPSEVRLEVPFTSQAPLENWMMPYQDACEEATILMALRYAEGKSIESAEEAAEDLRLLASWNVEMYGDSVDESIEEVQELLQYMERSLSTRILVNPTIEDLQRELAQENIVIVPHIGWQMDNPYFRPGVLYHMLVLTGYDDQGNFITNEPGTQRGKSHRYPFGRIMNAMHDLNDPLEEGRKAVLVVELL